MKWRVWDVGWVLEDRSFLQGVPISLSFLIESLYPGVLIFDGTPGTSVRNKGNGSIDGYILYARHRDSLEGGVV